MVIVHLAKRKDVAVLHVRRIYPRVLAIVVKIFARSRPFPV